MKKRKAARDIKSRFIAAICMLMVSVIMMVSTSYAWFTLSTAPEVKGIQTAVGANGNLEIALLGTANSFNNPDGISSAVGDSSSAANKSAITANTTWGNLVDLSDSSYGLSMISLLPSALERTVDVTYSTDAAGNPVYTRSDYFAAKMLQVPSYGADGRVNEVSSENTIVAPFNYATNTFGTVLTDPAKNPSYDPDSTILYGVRAVGTSSNRSQREITYDTALAQGGIYASQFRTDAVASLQANGNGLASLGTKQANGTNTFTQAEVHPLFAIVDSILGTRKFTEEDDGTMTYAGRAEDGLVDTAKQALTYYSTAAFASGLNTNTYDDDKTFTNAMTQDAITDFAANVPELVALKDAIAGIGAAATAADTILGHTEKASYTWDEIKNAVSALFSNMDVWGYEIRDLVDKVNTTEGMNEIMEHYAANGNKIIANINGGVYHLMADVSGEFSVTTGLYLNDQFQNMPTTMVAKKTAGQAIIMNTASAAISAKPAPQGAGDSPKISDAYGYVIDMAFRTNASDSNLLLQTAATQRISSSTNESTQGGGSSMTFRSGDANFTVEQMANLMQHISVVFFTPNASGTNDVLCIAKLDMGKTLYADEGGNAILTPVDGKYQIIERDENKNITAIYDPHYTVNATSKTITANLYVVGYTYTGTGTETDPVKETRALITEQKDAVICALDANMAKQISALVYLDGETVTNADVAVGGNSMSGTLNLQFSSSANLVPMTYSGTLGPANDVVKYDVNVVNGSTGFNASASGTALMGRDYTFIVTGEGTPGVAVTVKDAEGNETTVPPVVNGNEYTIRGSEVNGEITITLSGTATANP